MPVCVAYTRGANLHVLTYVSMDKNKILAKLNESGGKITELLKCIQKHLSISTGDIATKFVCKKRSSA